MSKIGILPFIVSNVLLAVLLVVVPDGDEPCIFSTPNHAYSRTISGSSASNDYPNPAFVAVVPLRVPLNAGLVSLNTPASSFSWFIVSHLCDGSIQFQLAGSRYVNSWSFSLDTTGVRAAHVLHIPFSIRSQTSFS